MLYQDSWNRQSVADKVGETLSQVNPVMFLSSTSFATRLERGWTDSFKFVEVGPVNHDYFSY